MKTAARSIAYYDTESTHLLFWFETHREGEQLHIRTLLNVLLDLVFIFNVFFFFSLLGATLGATGTFT